MTILLFYFQSADILKDIIINTQDSHIEMCEHSYNQLLTLVIWSLSTNIVLLLMIVFLESLERIKEGVRWCISKIRSFNE